ncbi:MAG: hypothetical protein K5682_02680 [Lachnospiraceae bacterium]|nr:hypothetical protein [Lachnospiraceae bacterium]
MFNISARIRIRSAVRNFFKKIRIVLVPVLLISPFRLIPVLEGFSMRAAHFLRDLVPIFQKPYNFILLCLLAAISVWIESRRVRIYCFSTRGEKFYLGSEFIHWGLPFHRRQFATVTVPARMAARNTTVRYLMKLPRRFPLGVSQSRLFIRINHEITETKARKTVKFHIEKNHLSQYTKT